MFRHLTWRNAKTVVVPFFWVPATVIFLNDNVAEVTRVHGESMEPSLSPIAKATGIRDSVLFKKWNVQEDIQRGDVVLFHSPYAPERMGTKRVIATEGDTVVLDPRRRPSNRASGADVPESLSWDMCKRKAFIPEGHVWVEGDNWRDSRDSNWYGPISRSLILGKAVTVTAPWDRFGTKPWEAFKNKTKVIRGDLRQGDEEWKIWESMGPSKPL